MKASYKELVLILMFVGIGVLIFSALTYMVEKEQASTTFTSVIDAFWWAVITMTTVGYGDVVPKTVMGRVVGSICAVTGTLVITTSTFLTTTQVIALPVPIVSENFSMFYKLERRRRMVHERRAALEKVWMVTVMVVMVVMVMMVVKMMVMRMMVMRMMRMTKPPAGPVGGEGAGL